MVAVGVIALGGYLGVRLTISGIDDARSLVTPSQLADAAEVVATFDCVQHEIDRRVPPGATIYLTGSAVSDDPLTHQRSVEGSYPRYDITHRRQDADFLVSINSQGGECAPGVDVVVERVR